MSQSKFVFGSLLTCGLAFFGSYLYGRYKKIIVEENKVENDKPIYVQIKVISEELNTENSSYHLEELDRADNLNHLSKVNALLELELDKNPNRKKNINNTDTVKNIIDNYNVTQDIFLDNLWITIRGKEVNPSEDLIQKPELIFLYYPKEPVIHRMKILKIDSQIIKKKRVDLELSNPIEMQILQPNSTGKFRIYREEKQELNLLPTIMENEVQKTSEDQVVNSAIQEELVEDQVRKTMEDLVENAENSLNEEAMMESAILVESQTLDMLNTKNNVEDVNDNAILILANNKVT
jgi:hypothetical protein